MNFDLYLFNLINQFALKWIWLDTFGIFFAIYFEYFLDIALILLLFIFGFKKYWRTIIKAFLAGAFSRLIVVNIIRAFWQRPRPFIEHNINLLLDHSNEPAFPSGHAAFYFAISTVVYFYNKKIGILFYIASLLLCLARIFVGFHWPLDVLAGIAIGVFSGWLVHFLAEKRGW